jgi:hypothetical protein
MSKIYAAALLVAATGIHQSAFAQAQYCLGPDATAAAQDVLLKYAEFPLYPAIYQDISSAALSQLLNKDNTCQHCKIQTSLWGNGQDGEISKITANTATGNQVKVDYLFMGEEVDAKALSATFTLQKNGGCWQIEDISTAHIPSLRKMLGN